MVSASPTFKAESDHYKEHANKKSTKSVNLVAPFVAWFVVIFIYLEFRQATIFLCKSFDYHLKFMLKSIEIGK